MHEKEATSEKGGSSSEDDEHDSGNCAAVGSGLCRRQKFQPACLLGLGQGGEMKGERRREGDSIWAGGNETTGVHAASDWPNNRSKTNSYAAASEHAQPRPALLIIIIILDLCPAGS